MVVECPCALAHFVIAVPASLHLQPVFLCCSVLAVGKGQWQGEFKVRVIEICLTQGSFISQCK